MSAVEILAPVGFWPGECIANSQAGNAVRKRQYAARYALTRQGAYSATSGGWQRLVRSEVRAKLSRASSPRLWSIGKATQQRGGRKQQGRRATGGTQQRVKNPDVGAGNSLCGTQLPQMPEDVPAAEFDWPTVQEVCGLRPCLRPLRARAQACCPSEGAGRCKASLQVRSSQPGSRQISLAESRLAKGAGNAQDNAQAEPLAPARFQGAPETWQTRPIGATQCNTTAECQKAARLRTLGNPLKPGRITPLQSSIPTKTQVAGGCGAPDKKAATNHECGGVAVPATGLLTKKEGLRVVSVLNGRGRGVEPNFQATRRMRRHSVIYALAGAAGMRQCNGNATAERASVALSAEQLKRSTSAASRQCTTGKHQPKHHLNAPPRCAA